MLNELHFSSWCSSSDEHQLFCWEKSASRMDLDLEELSAPLLLASENVTPSSAVSAGVAGGGRQRLLLEGEKKSRLAAHRVAQSRQASRREYPNYHT
jgi:hypothetical protein